ncbi:hypothetical protein Syun_007474 [Stephania yunnanensis]|uniref:Uncharacterized protein n=1 Tax=Stephania yunnanensis TaxID=152371 RepID=A0AAP0L022_9MAGN
MKNPIQTFNVRDLSQTKAKQMNKGTWGFRDSRTSFTGKEGGEFEPIVAQNASIPIEGKSILEECDIRIVYVQAEEGALWVMTRRITATFLLQQGVVMWHIGKAVFDGGVEEIVLAQKIGRDVVQKSREFNNDMLMKQVWRLIMNGDSLAARLLREREGCRWKVGDGSLTYVFHELRFFDPIQLRVQIEVVEGLRETKVCLLLCTEARMWDADVVQDIFDDIDLSLIFSIPLSLSHQQDLGMWGGDIKWTYRVKSGYRSLIWIQ